MRARTTSGIAIAAVSLIVVVVVTTGMYTPKRRQLLELTTDVAKAEEKLTNVMRHSGALDQASALLPKRSEDGEGDQRFLSEVNGELRRMGLELKRIEPKEVDETGEFIERSYQVDVEGRYSDAIGFLRHLEDLPEVVFVSSFDVRSSTVSPGSTHKFSFKLRVVGY